MLVHRSDHRVKENYDLVKVMDGAIEDSIQTMIMADQKAQLEGEPGGALVNMLRCACCA